MDKEFIPKVRRSPRETINDKMLRGKNLLQVKRYEEALSIFDEIITVNPEIGKVYLYAGKALLALRSYEKALVYINHALKINTMDPTVCVIAGEVHLGLKNLQEALEYFQNASQLDVNFAKAYFGMGRVFHEYQEYEKAIRMFRHTLELDQNDRRAYAALAKSYLAKKDQQEGEIDIRNDDIFDLITRGTHISMLEEEELNKMLDSANQEDLEERISDLQYITTWLDTLIEQFHWQANYLKRSINSSGRYIVPRGMEEGFEEFLK